MANKVTSFQVGDENYNIDPDLTFDSTPTIGSNNPVTSNGIALAVQGAMIGTDISVGRKPDTPIGYCSIAYGEDIVSAEKYSIVFGNGNTVHSGYSIVCGVSLTWLGGHSNAVFGNSITGNGYYNMVAGSVSKLGYNFKNILDQFPYQPEIYSGYFDLTTKKLYYDPEHTTEHVITFDEAGTLLYGTTYVVDLSSDGGRTPGTIYEYTKTIGGVTTAFEVLERYVCLTDKAMNTIYYYAGPSYYNVQQDKNYRYYDGGQYSDEIFESSGLKDRDHPVSGFIYFDVLSGNFLLYCKTRGRYGTHPDWIKVKAYRLASIANKLRENSYNMQYRARGGNLFYTDRYGRLAYVYTDSSTDASRVGKVYSSPDFTESSEITNLLYDGEIVVNMSTTGDHQTDNGQGEWYLYRFTSDHVLAYYCKFNDEITSDNPVSTYGSGLSYREVGSSIIVGSFHEICGNSYGMTISGRDHSISGSSSQCAIFGLSNKVSVGAAGPMYSLLAGYGNTITSSSNQCHTNALIGQENSVLSYGDLDNIYIIGKLNTVNGEPMMNGTIVLGYSNNGLSIANSHIYGRANNVKFEGESHIIGSFNEIGHFHDIRSGSSPIDINFSDLWLGSNGILYGSGVSYDSSTSMYTYPTNTIFRKLGILNYISTHEDAKDYHNLGYFKSTDAHTITELPNFIEYNSIYVMGYDNYYSRYISSIGSGYYNRGNIILGRNNKMYAFGNDTNVLIGKGLIYYHGGPASPTQEGGSDYDQTATQGTVIVGKYNAMSSMPDGSFDSSAADQCGQFIVGIGTSENDRKNGFVVYNKGIASLPNTPDSVTAASSLANFNPNKLIVTLGMLRDYAPQTPGAVGKPAVTTVTLTTAGWNNTTDQTISLPDILASSVVMIQASGNPYAFYLHNIYLSTQIDGSLTFTCTTAPQVDIPVKVVYWT